MKKPGSYSSQQTEAGIKARRQTRTNDSTLRLTWPVIDWG
jgi:hypothetical protein